MPWFEPQVRCAHSAYLGQNNNGSFLKTCAAGFRFFAISACMVPLLGSLAAQDVAPSAITLNNRTGDIPYSDRLGTQFEHVELATGNLIVTIPIVDVPGRGMSFQYALRYDAAFWTTERDLNGAYYWTPEKRNWLTSSVLGWTSNQPYMTFRTGMMSCYTGALNNPGTTNNPTPNPQGSRLDTVIFTDSNCSKHEFLINSQSNGDCAGGSYNFNNVSGPSTGQDGYFGSTNSVTDPNGVVYTAGGTSGSSNGLHDVFTNMATMTDNHGNHQTLTPGGTDTVGRVPLTQQITGNQIIYTVYDSNGNPQLYKINLETINISTAFNATFPGPVREDAGTRTVIASVVLPNLESYAFSYDSYGDITEMSLPTGGTVSYTWSNQSLPGGSVVRHVTTRTVDDGHATAAWGINYVYADSNNAYGDWADTVTVTSPQDPAGISHKTVYTYDLGFASSPALVDIQYDPSGSTSLRHFQMTYTQPDQYSLTGSSNPVYTQPLLKSITATLNAGTSAAVTSKREFDYDIFGFQRYDVDCTDPSAESDCESQASSGGFPTPSVRTMSRGNATAIREYADGSTSPGPLTRQTIRTYLQDANPSYGMTLEISLPKKLSYSGPNVVDRPTDEAVYDASPVCTGTGTVDGSGNFVPPTSCGATKRSEKIAQYDNQTPSSYGYHGDQTALQAWLNTPTSSYLTTQYVYNTYGSLTKITDPKIHSTTIGYADNFASGASTCSIVTGSSAYPTSVTDALQHVRKLAYYGCTGKVSADKDPNDIAAGRAGNTWTYDSMGRILTNVLRDGGQISNTYSDDYPATTTTSVLISSGVSKTSVAQYDGLAREVKSSLTSDPQGAVNVNTSYDLLGRKYTVSNPYRSTSEATYGVTSTLYDGIDRPLIVTEPDGGQQSWQYSGHSITFKDEAGNQWTRTSDALGRLIRVLEPNGSSAAPSMETDYVYDQLNNLTKVNQWGGASGSANARVRTFVYDSLSRLILSDNPEAGWLCYGTTNSAPATSSNCTPSYDGAGNLSAKTDARGITISYAYDPLNRVTSKQYSNGTPSVLFGYDGKDQNGQLLSPAVSNAIGRMSASWNGTNSGTRYSYDKMGRLSARWDCVPGNCTYSLKSSGAYDSAGNLVESDLMSGDSEFAAYGAANRLGFVKFGVTGASPASQTALFSNPSYGPVGLTEATLGNGLREELEYDNRARITAFEVGEATSAAYGGSAPIGYVDSAANEKSGGSSTPVGGLLKVTGWAADNEDGSPVAQVVILIDGNPIGQGALGGARPDVANAYSRSDFLNSGYTFTGPIGGISPGTHYVTAAVYDWSGNRSTTNGKTITITSDSAPFGSFDSIKGVASGTSTVPSGGQISVVGWAADQEDGSPISKVVVLLDGESIGSSVLGGSRPDVATAYNNSAYTNSGWHFTGSIQGASVGTHSVSVALFDSSGNEKILAAPSTISVVQDTDSILGSLDSAANTADSSSTVPLGASLTVRGWAGEPDQTPQSPVSLVEIYIDNQLLGNATLGGARADVARVYGSGYQTSGWNFNGTVSNVDPGQHSIWARVYSKSGGSFLLGPAQITVAGVVNTLPATSLPAQYSYNLNYAANGNVLSAADSVNGSWTYTYDTLNRLVSARSATTGLAWTYDPFGNRFGQTATAGSAPQPQVTFSTTTNRIDGFCYDATGNVLDDGPCQARHKYAYDAEGRLQSSDYGQAVYTYDAEGNRVAKQIGGTITNLFFYDVLGRRAVDTDGALNVLRTELYAGSLHVGTYTGGTYYYTHNNWLGTETARTDASGSICQTTSSLPFGDNAQSSGSCSPSPNFFTGKERDSESGNDYFGARYYGSSMGRFMSPDSDVDQDMKDPQSWSLYGYVRNNPLTNTDPDGHAIQICTTLNGTQHCTDGIDDDVYKEAQQSKANGGLTGPSLVDLQNSRTGTGDIKGSDGNVVGTVKWTADNSGIQGPQAIQAFGQIARDGNGAIKFFGEQMAWNLVGGAAGHGVGLAFDAAIDAVLQKAGSAVGNQGMKVISRIVAEKAAKEWVGEGARVLTNRNTGEAIGLMSADGTRVARFTSAETKGYINLEDKTIGSNLHVRW